MSTAPLNHMADTWWDYVAHASWQATVVGLLVILLVRVGRRWSSPLRYWLLLVALVKFALPPTLFAPQGVFGFLEPPPAISALHPDAVMANWSAIQDALARPVRSRSPGRVRHSDTTPAARAIAKLRTISIWQELYGLLPVLHLLGGMTLALLIMRRVAHCAGPRGGGVPVEYGDLHRRFLNIQASLALRRKVQLRLCDENRIPTASGLVRPVVTIGPALVKSLSSDDLDLVLCHELAHHRRGDILLGWLQLALCCAWWFNPVVWLLSGEIRRTREECCDDLVLSLGQTSLSAYCQALLHAVRGATRHARPATVLGLADRLPPLGHRMRRILDASLRHRTRLSIPGALTTVLAAALLLPGSDAHDQHGKRETARKGKRPAAAADRTTGARHAVKIQVVPRRPFQWTAQVADEAKCEGLVRELRDALLAKSMAPDRVACQSGHLRIDDIETYAALQGILADHGIVKVRHLDIVTRIFSVALDRLREAEVDWRFMTHTGQASDLVQYVTLTSDQAQGLRQRLTQNDLAQQIGAPRLKLLNAQRGNVTLGLSKAYVKDYKVVPEGDRSVFVPQVEHALTGHSLEVCPHLSGDDTLTVNVAGWFCDPASVVTQSRSLRIGTGPTAVELPVQQPVLKPSRFDVQFRLSSTGSILFTRHDLVTEPSGGKPRRIRLVMLDVAIARSDTTPQQP